MWREACDHTGDYRFDVEITSKDCPPVKASISVCVDAGRTLSWNKPEVLLLEDPEDLREYK
jgi:hypothetical protein